MARLVLHIRNLQTGKTEERRFDHSPVRIGRHPRNELALDFPFVSQWHGILSFDETSCTYLDQGSTNGSYLDGRRLASAQATPIGAQSELRIGVLRLRAERQVAAAPLGPGDGDPTIQARLPQGGFEAPPHGSGPFTPPEIHGPAGEGSLPDGHGPSLGGAGEWERGWRAALPPPGAVLDEGFLERLSHALERLASLVDSQCTRDPDLAAALQRIAPEGTGDALLAFLLDPSAPAGERAGEMRSALG